MKNEMPGSKEFAHYNDEYDYLQSAASAQDCTGLMPTPATNKAEEESYEELYPILPKIPIENDIEYVED